MSLLETPDSWNAGGQPASPTVEPDPLANIPRLSRRQVQLEERLGPAGSRIGSAGLLGVIGELLGEGLKADRFEVSWRAAGLNRTGVVAQLNWPRLGTRIGLGIEPPLAHALVDRLLGFERLPAEGRLQVTPVEWGILSFVVAQTLDRLDENPGPLGPWDLTLDRLGPERFDVSDLGPIVTWRWRVKLGSTSASARLWLPEALVALWLIDSPAPPSGPIPVSRFAEVSSVWRAEAGTIAMSRGLSRLRAGSLLLIDGSPLSGTPDSPEGRIDLVLDDPTAPSYFEARSVPDSAAARLILGSPLRRDARPGENAAMSVPPAPNPPSGAVAPADSPVTLTVELGKINLPLHRLADLKPGDVLELGRHSREPVELTSGGRLIARGELVQVDTELGVRVTQVFL